MKTKFLLVAAAFLAAVSFDSTTFAQHPKPKRVTPRHIADRTLSERFKALACASVHIESDAGLSGSGAFISPDGDVLTASHVVFDRTFNASPSAQGVSTAIQAYSNLIVYTSSSEPYHVTATPTTANGNMAWDDLAIIKTGIHAPCSLKLGDSNSVEVGAHLIAIGYPSWGSSQTLYDGFLSSRLRRGQFPVAQQGDTVFWSHDEVLRLQMPISDGVSGGPVLDDNDRVIGVVVEMPMPWPATLNAPMEQWKGVQKAIPSLTPELRNQVMTSPGVMTGSLAWVVREFGSPGMGLAVPLSYLDTRKEPTH